jgi:hypothetical protein
MKLDKVTSHLASAKTNEERELLAMSSPDKLGLHERFSSEKTVQKIVTERLARGEDSLEETKKFSSF